MKQFAVICGPGRSGTSLATSLVEACGYNLGKVNEPNIPHRWEGLRAGYGEHPLSNAQGEAIEAAIDELEAQGANCVKLIHLYAQWIPRLKARGYDVRIVVTSRPEEEIWESGQKLYTGWQPQAISAICGTAKRILRETREYLNNPDFAAYELPFHKVVEKDKETLLGLVAFLIPDKNEKGERLYHGGQYAMWKKMEKIIRPDIVRHKK